MHNLASRLEIDAALLASKMVFWINRGVLKEHDGLYRLISADDQGSNLEGLDINISFHFRQKIKLNNSDTKNDIDLCDHSTTMTVAEQKDAEMQIYWTYIVGMLTNLGPSQPARIHSMLGMFVQAPNKYDRELMELARFLESMAQAGKLECNGGKYSIKRA